MIITNSSGHTTQLGPHAPTVDRKAVKDAEHFSFDFKQSREHILTLLILLFFSANVALAYIHFSTHTNIVDSVPTPDFLASLGSFLSI